MMVVLLAAEYEDVEFQLKSTTDAHARFNLLGEEFASSHDSTTASKVDVRKEGMHMYRDQSIRIYLLYLDGIMFFSDKSVAYVNVPYVKYLYDLKLVSDYA